ncbi:MAG: DUF1385 domain-containing protein [Lachnospiraceae bacterium]|nr:DUF1385 domain-containing protein [Lachnospiraceae bacterium]
MAKEKKRKTKAYYSGIGGQAVLEGIMMKNKDKYAVAVRKPDDEIEVDIDEYSGVLKGHVAKEIPFLRGVFNFIDSLVLGMKTINYSASFYEDDVTTETKFEKLLNKVFRGKADKVISAVVTVFSVALAIGIFIILPYFLTGLLTKNVRNDTLTNLIEGLIRIIIFVLYVLLISLSKDIKRVYMYHGAEHKCINCIEHGHPLTVNNVMKSSRLHRRCGTSFLLLVILVSIVLFFFIHVDSRALRLVIRVLLIPVIAGISYEILRLAGRTSGLLIKIISAPGLLLQKITTREPDEKMVEVAISAVEAVFDWKDFLKEKFNWEEEETSQEVKEP